MRFCSVTKTKEESPVGDSFSNAMEMNNEVVGTKTFPQKVSSDVILCAIVYGNLFVFHTTCHHSHVRCSPACLVIR